MKTVEPQGSRGSNPFSSANHPIKAGLVLGLLASSIACASATHDEASASAAPVVDSRAALDLALRARLLEADKLYQEGKAADAGPLYDSLADVVPSAGDAAQRELVASAADKAVLCYQELAKEEPSRVAAVADGVPIPIRGYDEKLLRAVERALKFVGDDKERGSNLRYVLGRLYYRYNRLEAALDALTQVIAQVPDEAIACQAAHLSLDIHNSHRDFATLADAARAFATDDRLACAAKDKATFLQVAQQAAFKRIEKAYEGNVKPQEAAEAYQRFADEYPSGDLSCAALYNAMVSYRAAKQPADESRVHKLLSRRCGDWMKRNRP